MPETAERVIAGRPVALPALDIHTVGAGGGSIAWRDAGGALRVGPASAGAEPGPACYRRGGTEPTVTDANLLLGRLGDDAPLAGEVSLDRAAAESAIARLAGELGLDLLGCAEGIVRVAEAEMLAALRVVTVERGIDPRPFALMPFGGAGPLHAAALADGLGISRVLCPRASGVLSALGLAAAPPRRDAARTVMLSAAQLDGPALDTAREELLSEAAAALGTEPLRARLRHELRYRGQSFELPVDEERGRDPGEPFTAAALREAFAVAHEARYGYRDGQAEVELVNLRASVWGPAPPLRPRAAGTAAVEARDAADRLRGPTARCADAARRARPRDARGGPGAVRAARVDAARAPRLVGAGRRAGHDRDEQVRAARRMSLDPIELQVLTGALRAACQEMGVVLIRSAHSSNIKERRDASTGLFDGDGQMVMQAEHIPVHLGAMPAAVRAVLAERHEPGVSWVLNDPFAGGTHLPDITVITPVFHAGAADRLRGQPRAPRRRRRGPAGVDARRQHLARAGGRRDRAAPVDRGGARRDHAGDAPAARARGRPARAAGREPRRRRAPLGVGPATRRRAPARGHRRGARLLRAAHTRMPGEPGGRGLRGARRARGAARGSRAVPARRAPRRASAARLRRQRAPARGQPQLPAGRDGVGVPVRGARADGPGYPADRGRLPAGRGACARRHRAQRPPGGRGRGGQRRDLLAGGRSRAERLRPGAGPGHDEQPVARQRALLLLRDAGRRPGRLRGRRRPERGARRDEQHAQHADRGARARVPAAGGRVLAAARVGRGRAPAGRRRRRARAGSARGDELLADRRAPAARPRAERPAAATERPDATRSTAARCPARRRAR